jgi:NADH dehydrogenase
MSVTASATAHDAPPRAGTARPHVVIIGGGFAGLSAARGLARANVDITVIDRTNHHAFQPLLYQVATAMLAPSDITVPIRWVLRHQRNARVMLANVRQVDPVARTLVLDAEPGELRYDYLVMATGARHAYFGHDAWERHAPGLKSVDDALEMRRRLLLAFELAEITEDAAERAALMTTVIVGAGPTGVELAGILHEMACGMKQDFRRIDTSKLRVVLVEGGPRVLGTFPESLSQRALRDLEAFGVEVRTGTIVTDIDAQGVRVGDETIAARTVLWAAGNRASSLGVGLGALRDRAGRVVVEPTLQVPGHAEVFVVGDVAACTDVRGVAVPAVAPAANQMGAHAAANIRRLLAGEALRPFRYLNKGDLATIGRHKAVASIAGFRLTGYLAWFVWVFVHIMYLVGFRNRAVVLLQWSYMYFTYQRGVRLITGNEAHGPPHTGEWPVPAMLRGGA